VRRLKVECQRNSEQAGECPCSISRDTKTNLLVTTVHRQLFRRRKENTAGKFWNIRNFKNVAFMWIQLQRKRSANIKSFVERKIQRKNCTSFVLTVEEYEISKPNRN
jgi:hypothetical protein